MASDSFQFTANPKPISHRPPRFAVDPIPGLADLSTPQTPGTPLGLGLLPIEVLSVAFMFLDIDDLGTCQQVCKVWHDLIREIHWREAYKRHWGELEGTHDESAAEHDWKELVRSKIGRPYVVMPYKLEEFYYAHDYSESCPWVPVNDCEATPADRSPREVVAERVVHKVTRGCDTCAWIDGPGALAFAVGDEYTPEVGVGLVYLVALGLLDWQQQQASRVGSEVSVFLSVHAASSATKNVLAPPLEELLKIQEETGTHYGVYKNPTERNDYYYDESDDEDEYVMPAAKYVIDSEERVRRLLHHTRHMCASKTVWFKFHVFHKIAGHVCTGLSYFFPKSGSYVCNKPRPELYQNNIWFERCKVFHVNLTENAVTESDHWGRQVCFETASEDADPANVPSHPTTSFCEVEPSMEMLNGALAESSDGSLEKLVDIQPIEPYPLSLLEKWREDAHGEVYDTAVVGIKSQDFPGKLMLMGAGDVVYGQSKVPNKSAKQCYKVSPYSARRRGVFVRGFMWAASASGRYSTGFKKVTNYAAEGMVILDHEFFSQ